MSTPPKPAPTYGFVGVGTMSSAIVRGLCTLSEPPAAIVLSPRGAQKAAALASEFGSIVTVASSNQEVVDKSDVVFIGVLPKQYEDACRELNFSPSHTVCSLVSTAKIATLHELCAPAPPEQITRAIPLPPVAKHRGATLLYPNHTALSTLFDALGTCVPVTTEEQLQKMLPVSCLMGQFYAQQRATMQWLQKEGVDSAAAAKWTGAVFHCISYDSANATPHTFDELVAEQTPGGLNEQVIREMTEAGVYHALTDSLDNCIARILGRPAPQRTKRSYSSAFDAQ